MVIPTTEEPLWSSLEETLGDVASLPSAASVKDLVWLRVAQDLDKQAWHETSMTAHDLLSAPDYGLMRKIIADGSTETIISCVGLGPNFCQLVHDTTMDWCEVLDAACTIQVAFCRRQVDICECKTACYECTGNGGDAESGSCDADCEDTSNDCL